MSRVTPKTICACEPQEHLSVLDVETYLGEWGAIPLSSLKTRLEDLNVFSILSESKRDSVIRLRLLLQQSKFPFRIRSCPNNYTKCCGDCIQFCDSRCIADVQHRAWLFISSNLASGLPVSEWSMLNRAVYSTFQPPVDYAQAISIVYGILNRRTNPKLKKNMIELFGEGSYKLIESHPHKFYYGVTDVYNNPVTGSLQFEFYPRSGLCPFCIPNVSPSSSFFYNRSKTVKKQEASEPPTE